VAVKTAVTLRDVAAHANVSVMTVSAVLSGKADERRISTATRIKVQESARLLGYRPNAVARSLRRRSTNVIGLYSGLGYLNAANPFLAELIGGLQEACDRYRKDLLLLGTFRGLSVDDIYAELLDGRLDGLVVQAPPSDPLVTRLAESHLPVVAVADTFPCVPSVVVDDAAGGRLIAEHLFEEGYRQAVYVAKADPIVSSERRRSSFLQTALRLGIAVSEVACRSEVDSGWQQSASAHCTTASDRPTAVCCWCDLVALSYLHFCVDNNVSVPGEVAVTGFDGFSFQGALRKPLTTIRAPWDDVGRASISLLVGMQDDGAPPRETVIPVELVRGETT